MRIIILTYEFDRDLLSTSKENQTRQEGQSMQIILLDFYL